jgi:hypothetical protein
MSITSRSFAWLFAILVSVTFGGAQERRSREEHRLPEPIQQLPFDPHPAQVIQWSNTGQKRLLPRNDREPDATKEPLS